MIGWVLGTALAVGATLEGGSDLESDSGGLVGSGSPGQWEWGEVTSGPRGGFTGSRAWATVLDGPHLNNALDMLAFPPASLAGLLEPMMICWLWVDLEGGDQAWLEAKVGGVWTPIDPVYGYPEPAGFTGRIQEWMPVAVDVAGLADLSHLRMSFSSDAAVSAAGVYLDDVSLWDGDVAAPLLESLSIQEDTEDLDGPYTVTLEAQDNQLLSYVDLLYSVNSGAEQVVAMSPVTGNTFTGLIPGQPHDTTVSYRVEAGDGSNLSWLPSSGVEQFRVRLPAPDNLQGPEGVVHATEALLSWSAPVSSHGIEGYRVFRSGAEEQDVTDLQVTVELLGGGADHFSVAARFDVGVGDATDEVEIDSAVTRLLKVEPSTLFQGDRVRVFLEGENLLFVQGEVDVDLGVGIDVSEPEVANVDGLSVMVEVQQDAPTGMTDVRVRSGSLDAIKPSGIVLLDGAQRPRLVRIHPQSARQGDAIEIQVDASDPFGDLPVADLGAGIIVQSLEALGESQVRLLVEVAANAPLGERFVELDDGVRIYEGVSFQVFDQVQPTSGCGVTRGSGRSFPLGALLLVALVCVRSRQKARAEPPQR